MADNFFFFLLSVSLEKIYTYEEVLAKSDHLTMKCYYVLMDVIVHSERGSVVTWHNVYNLWYRL